MRRVRKLASGYAEAVPQPLRIGLCGGLVVGTGGKQIEANLAGHQGRELFAYLVLNRDRPVSRDELAALLWPDQPPRAPEASLNTILARLRRVLGHSVLDGRAQLTVRLPAGSWIDVEAAEDAAIRAHSTLAQGSAAEAIELASSALAIVAAPLLPDVRHAWIDQRRIDVDDLRSRLLAMTVRAGLAAGGPSLDAAERGARALIEREPFRESGYALLMEVHAARGDIAEALLVYERLRTLLRSELGIPPSARVAALHEKLVRHDSSIHSVLSQSVRQTRDADESTALPEALTRSSRKGLVGRERELSVLSRRWAELAGETCSIVTLAGESGIGKTALAATFGREVHEGGGIVLYGRAQEDAIIPYAPLVEALRHYVAHGPDLQLDKTLRIHIGELGWLIPELADHRSERRVSTGDARLERLRLYQAVAALVARIAADRPVLLVLEDLHCADTETILMLRQLLREATRRPMLALLTYQDGSVTGDHPLSRLLSDLRHDLCITRVILHGLEVAAIGELFGDAERPTAEFLRYLREHTSGNPFFIEEIVRDLRETGSSLADVEIAVEGSMPLPDGVQELIQDRLHRLAPVTRDVLAAAAVLGHEFDEELIEAVFGDEDVATALDPAVGSGLIVDASQAGGHYCFCHGLARQSIYRSIGRSRRAHLHLLAAQALEQRRRTGFVEAAELAHHFIATGRSEVADRAISFSCEAATRARAARAYEDAALHYRRAIEVLERHRADDTATRCELLLELGNVCWQGSGPGARLIFEQAVAVARGMDEYSRFAEATLGLGGRFYAPTGPDEPYIRLLEEALQWVCQDDPLHIRVLGRLAEHLGFADPSKAARMSQRALAAARDVGDPLLLASTLLSRHAALLHVQHLDERKRLATEAVELAHRNDERELEALAHHWLLYDVLEAGELDNAARLHAELQRLADELGQPLYRHSALVWLRVLEQLSGRFEHATQLAYRALNLARGADDEGAQTHFIAQQLAIVPDRGGGEKLLPVVDRWAATGDPLWAAAAGILSLTRTAESPGLPSRHASEARHLADLPHNVMWLTTLAWLAEACPRTGDHEQAAVLYELLSPYAARFVQLTFNGSFGCLHRHLGLLAVQLGRSRQATEHFEEAVNRHANIPAPALEARTLCDYAEASLAGGAAGSTRDATTMIKRAARLAKACGATRTLERLTWLTQLAVVDPR